MLEDACTPSPSRRRVLKGLTAAAALVYPGAAIPALAEKTVAASAPAGEDYYEKLGVERIINAAGTYTYLTAACMPPSVIAAVERAAHHPVRLRELQEKAGAYIAQRLHCEAAMVTSGASGAISLATAACMQHANNIGPLDMPQNIAGARNQVVVQKAHRYGYDHAMYLSGARVTEVVTMEDYKRALGEGNAVMTNFFNAAEDGDADAQIGREEWLRVAHDHNVPCHMDAAADMPPISNLWKYTGMGYDLVSFSGGKGMRGPQNAGLLLGKKEFLTLAQQSNNPDDGIGRGMKVAKEQIVGMVAAVDWVLSHSDDNMQEDYNERVARIVAQVRDIPSVATSVKVPGISNHVPHLLIHFDPARVGKSTQQIVDELRAGKPSIELNPGSGHPERKGIAPDVNTIVVGVWMMQPGEDEIVGRRLRAALTGKA
ncbi:selenocysteine synthase [Silvibacterium sp.]|uniref:selenocysteine synthase n=1 Tax=Silvibacterium sp. TaxID=1964179 RepID=UPI0039E441DA